MAAPVARRQAPAEVVEMVEPLVDLTVDPVVVKLGLVVVVLFGMDGGSWWMRVPTGMTAHSGTEWMDRTARQWRPGLGQTVVPTEAFVGGDILFFAPRKFLIG